MLTNLLRMRRASGYSLLVSARSCCLSGTEGL